MSDEKPQRRPLDDLFEDPQADYLPPKGDGPELDQSLSFKERVDGLVHRLNAEAGLRRENQDQSEKHTGKKLENLDPFKVSMDYPEEIFQAALGEDGQWEELKDLRDDEFRYLQLKE